MNNDKERKQTANNMVEKFVTENTYGRGEVISWASILDDNCRAQAEAISRVPILDGHLALMPDAHFGFGPPVGSALITEDAVMPYAVGVDIGCGMIAVNTDIEREQLRGMEGKILGQIRERIPSGVGTSHKAPTALSDAFFFRRGDPPGAHLAKSEQSLIATAKIQFGTLGSGNHFVEVCEDTNGMVWLLLHSGSRGVGNQLANAHQKLARAFCEQEGILLESHEFSFFPRGIDDFDSYIADMLWCQAYAFEQRFAMLEALINSVTAVYGSFEYGLPINCHHNYAERLSDGRWLTRKGAINATEGVMGIIPGSMGAATYIVRGLGNPLSYNTSPHGAGRILGRKEAHRTLDVDDFKTQMEGRTWLDRDAEKLLDEAPSAYKPIETVINDSKSLVQTVTVLQQFINYKGL